MNVGTKNKRISMSKKNKILCPDKWVLIRKRKTRELEFKPVKAIEKKIESLKKEIKCQHITQYKS